MATQAITVVLSYDAARGEHIARVLSPSGYHVCRVTASADALESAAMQALADAGMAFATAAIKKV